MSNRKVTRKEISIKATPALPTLLLGLLIPLLVSGQSSSRLEVEVSPARGVNIMAQQVSYGEVLRTFQRALDVPMEIPQAADQLALSYVRIDAATPAEALEKLLAGSGLGYALLRQVGGGQLKRVIVVPGEKQTGSAIDATTLATGPSLPSLPAAAQALLPAWPEGQAVDDREREITVPEAEQRSLTEAGEVIGMEARSDVAEAVAEQVYELPLESYPVVLKLGRLPVTRPLSEAAEDMGVPPGVSPEEVGKMKTYSLPTGKKRP